MPLRIKLFLIAWGLGCGLLLVAGVIYFLGRIRSGSEFANLGELRLAMLKTSGPKDKSESLPLGEILNPHPDDRIIFDLRPNLDIIFQKVRVQTNSCGMRNEELSIAKPEHTFRLALLGDSFAFGWGVEANQTFAHILEQNLNRWAKPDMQVEVLNFGVPGYSTFQEAARFISDGQNFSPDAVLVFFVDNDVGLPFYVRDIDDPGGFMPASIFGPLSWAPKDPRINEQRLKLLGFDANSYLGKLADFCQAKGINLFLAVNPSKSWQKDLERLWILKSRPDIKVINLRRPMLTKIRAKKIPVEDLTLADDPHPSPLKHKLLADMLTPYFMPYFP